MFSYRLPFASCSAEILISVALVAFVTHKLHQFRQMTNNQNYVLEHILTT